MILTDVNVLIYAFRRDTERHADYRAWLEKAMAEEPTFGVAELVLNAVVRIATHPRIFKHPSSLDEVLDFCAFLLDQPNVVRVAPGTRHWNIFTKLCREINAKGNLVSDAYFAALAMEAGAEWITADRDFARFPKLRWRHPLA